MISIREEEVKERQKMPLNLDIELIQSQGFDGDDDLYIPHSATTFSQLRSKFKRHSRQPKSTKLSSKNTRGINWRLRSEQLRREEELALRESRKDKMIAIQQQLGLYYPSYLQDQVCFIFCLCLAKKLLDNLNQQENTLIKQLELLMNQLVSEYLNQLVKGENKNLEYITYLEEIVRKGAAMVNKMKELGASPEDMLIKIKEFSETAQANRRQLCFKIRQIVELLVFVAIGAVIGGFLGYAVGHLFFLHFANTAISAGFSTGASLGLALGKSGLGVGAVAAANLSVWSRFSIFYKETPLEMLCNKAETAAINIVSKRSNV